jgi:hypothetical protein
MVPVFERLHELEILPNSSTVEGTVQNSRKLVDELCAIISNGFNDVLNDESASDLTTEPTAGEASFTGDDTKEADSTVLGGISKSGQISGSDELKPQTVPASPPRAVSAPEAQVVSGLPEYNHYTGPACHDPRVSNRTQIADDLLNIVKAEGPIQVKRAFDIYLRSCGIKRMGHELRDSLLGGVGSLKGLGQLLSHKYKAEDDALSEIIWIQGTSAEVVRKRGDRSLEEIPLGELYGVAQFVASTTNVEIGSEEHLRAVLDVLDLKRLTSIAGLTLKGAIAVKFNINKS